MDLEERLASSLSDRYTIEAEIGRGGMATVFLAQELKHQRKVAIKVLNPDVSEALGFQRFLREIDTAAGLTHPHILPLHDSGSIDGLLYYVMPFVEGESLRARLEREKQLPVEDAMRITLEAARALAHAHHQGLVHRDVKPANILLESGQAVLADFGLAQAMERAGEGDVRLTQTGVSLGTPAYMSPEQAAGEQNLDGRSDQYSLACILFEMLAGEPAFMGPNPQAILAKKLSSPPPPVTLFRSSVPPAVDAVIRKALERAPVDRFPSMEEFSGALEQAAAAPIGTQAGDTAPFKTRPSWPLPTVTLAALMGLVLLVMWIFKPGNGAAPPWGDGHPSSVAVLPFHTAFSSDGEAAMAVEVADRVARELDRWDEVRALGSTALSGIIHDLGVSEATFRSSNTAIRVAGEAGVEALLGVTVQVSGDSVLMEGNLYAPSRGDLVGDGLSARGPLAELGTLATSLSHRLLGLEGTQISTRNPGTTSLRALRAFLRGRQALLQTDFQGARMSFADALELDENFAPAHAWLALATYWDAVAGSARFSRVRSDIARHGTLATENLAGLSGTDSLHVEAFFNFQRGEYQEARRLYERIVEMDPADILAWLMVGEVEVRDPWMVAGASGHLEPRADLSRALNAFQRTTSLRPTFELGYAKSFQIAGAVESAARGRGCPGFRPLGHELVPPGESAGVQDAQAFCPVFSDSVTWVASRQMDTVDRARVLDGAARIFERAIDMLRAWDRFAPGSSRPKELIADALQSQRERLRLASPEQLEARAVEALGYAEAALRLKGDTTAGDLFWVANLRLAAGEPQAALAAAEEALARHAATPDSVKESLHNRGANVFLGTGGVEKAVQIVRQSSGSRYVPDPSTGELISYAGAEPVVLTIRVLGATGVGGQPLLAELNRLDSLWNAAGYSDHEIQVLRDRVTPRIGPALLPDSVALRVWGGLVDLRTSLWGPLGLMGAGEEESVLLAAAGAALEGTDKGGRTYMIALQARRLGHLSLSLRLFSRLDSIPFMVGGLDSGWGFRTISLLQRAELLEELGRPVEAQGALERFLSEWSAPDAFGRTSVTRANGLLRRVTDSER